ncbi:hypothetical protein BLA6993_05499 [Burkholderia lata]|uniref:hypothetical protein n=1 Tax=Burkholderia lata (strain ATCC 17760 / DSM 23089 / LMG 22485 / NCIMB 9086 / R18194 / 383) TaxID=482957 RepID=UPI0014544ACA|nr:hypothetical protein [Burkholderia lata]VWC14128.1 hypothetical protein BLA6993_05499 [Burkholderia lata]
MKTYAQIYNGRVSEIIPPRLDYAGAEMPIEARYTPQFVATLVDITSVSPSPRVGWTYDGTKFSASV